jgi:eukaryotic-like serine/threonine-protein kinase
MSDANPSPKSDSLERDMWIDVLCDRFESALQAGQKLSLNDFLQADGIDPANANPNLLLELRKLEDHYHSQAGTSDQRTVEHFPAVTLVSNPITSSRIGTVIAGRYQLIRELGTGGMGTVYLAKQTKPVNRDVALKLIRTGINSRSILSRFEAERQAIALMNHPNIARFYDAGTTDEQQPFFVMEVVDGPPITEFCDQNRYKPKERLELFIQVCKAIQHAHNKGIIHRDIKPSNVLVTIENGQPTPKVIDFGVAKAIDQQLTDGSFQTGFGALVGTAEYMSPEQADINVQQDIDIRSDIYSLGVLLYELLTGTTPVDRKSLRKIALFEILRIVREVDAPRPSDKLSTTDALPSIAANRNLDPAKLVKECRGELDWILLKSLEKDRNRRYESAERFGTDVQHYLDDEIVEAQPPSRKYQVQKFLRKNRRPVFAAGSVLMALIFGMIGTTLGLIEAQYQAGVAKASFMKAQKAEWKAQRALAEAEYDRGNELLRAGDTQIGLLRLLKSLRAAEGSTDTVFENAVRYNLASWLPSSCTVELSFPGPENILCGCFSPSSDLVALGRSDQSISIHKTISGREASFSCRIPEKPVKLLWQPTGKYLAARSANGHIYLIAITSPNSVRRIENGVADWPEWLKNGFAFSPDGRFLAIAGIGSIATLWDPETGQRSGKVFGHGAPYCEGVAFSPDGSRLLLADGKHTATQWDIGSGKAIGTAIRTHGRNLDAAYHPNGKSFATAHFLDNNLQQWDSETGQPIGQKLPTLSSPSIVSYSSEGNVLLAAGADQSVSFHATENTNLKIPSIVQESGYDAAEFSKNKNHVLIISSKRAKIWKLPTTTPLWKSIKLKSPIGWCTFSPDGIELAVALFPYQITDPLATGIYRFSNRDGAQLGDRMIIGNGARWPESLGYTPDGKSIVGLVKRKLMNWSLETFLQNEILDLDKTQLNRVIHDPRDGRMMFGRDENSQERFRKLSFNGLDSKNFVSSEFSDTDKPTTLILSPDGRLLYSIGQKLKTWKSDDNTHLSTISLAEGITPGSRCIRPDGKVISFTTTNQKIMQVEIATGQLAAPVVSGPCGWHPFYARGGDLLVACSGNYSTYWHAQTAKPIGPKLRLNAICVSPRGDVVAGGNEFNQVTSWALPTPLLGSVKVVEAWVQAQVGLKQSEDQTVHDVSDLEWWESISKTAIINPHTTQFLSDLGTTCEQLPHPKLEEL